MASVIALSDAKATLSSVIDKVSKNSAEYIVTVRDKPRAMIVPMPQEPPVELKAFGVLHSGRPAPKRSEEKSAFASAMEAKHA